MEFIKNNWLILLVLFIVIYLVYKYWQKTKAVDFTKNQGVVNSNFNSTSGSVSSNTGSVINTPPLVTTSSPIETNPINWRIGDGIYAGATGVNTYSAPSPSQSGIIKYFAKDAYIGTYLGNTNGYAKIILQSKGNALMDAFGWEDNQVVYSLINQVYKK